MTNLLTLADHYGTAVHVIGTALALFFLALIASEPFFRARRRKASTARFDDQFNRIPQRRIERKARQS